MERRDIEIFLTLAAELHFGRTGERLRVSQARISQTIKKIERRIGAPLFERTSRRVSLTPIGRQLRDDVQPAYQEIQDAIGRAIAAGRGVAGVLGIGFEAPALADHIQGVITTFRARHRDCAVQIREAPFNDPFRLLRSGEVDILITIFPVEEPDLTAGPIVFTEPMVLAVPSRHPLARRETVSVEDLASDAVLRAARPVPPYWRDPHEPWTTPGGQAVRRGAPVTSFQELLGAIAAGEGICALGAHATRYFGRPNLIFIPFRDGPPAQWGLVWRAAGNTSRVRAFSRAAMDTLPATLSLGLAIGR